MELPNQARYTPYPLTTLLAGNSNLSSTFEQDPAATLYPLQSLLHGMYVRVLVTLDEEVGH